MNRETNRRSGKDIGKHLLVTLHRLPRPGPHSRATNAELITHRHYPMRHHTHPSMQKYIYIYIYIYILHNILRTGDDVERKIGNATAGGERKIGEL
nr:hypothetical protein Itr_chr04CG14500 [Ipomoea trifida]